MQEKIENISRWLGTGSINIFGLPFAGKDTQGKRLAELLDGTLISAGEIMRHDHGHQKAKDIMAAGGIVPAEMFEEIILPYLSRTELNDKPLILSEVGRQEGEYEVVLRVTKNSGHELKAVIMLAMPEEEVWQRFDDSRQEHDRGKRADDRREVLQTRLNRFKEKVVPIIGHYRDMGLLIEVDGSQSRDEVTNLIVDGLADLVD